MASRSYSYGDASSPSEQRLLIDDNTTRTSFATVDRAELLASRPVLPSPSNKVHCDWPQCPDTFTRPSDLTRHRNSVHHLTEHFWCIVPGCNRNESHPGQKHPFSRKDKRDAHVKSVHKILARAPAYAAGSPAYLTNDLAHTTGGPAYTTGDLAQTTGGPAYTAGSNYPLDGSASTTGFTNTIGDPANTTGNLTYITGPNYTLGDSACLTGDLAHTTGGPAYTSGPNYTLVGPANTTGGTTDLAVFHDAGAPFGVTDLAGLNGFAGFIGGNNSTPHLGSTSLYGPSTLFSAADTANSVDATLLVGFTEPTNDSDLAGFPNYEGPNWFPWVPDSLETAGLVGFNGLTSVDGCASIDGFTAVGGTDVSDWTTTVDTSTTGDAFDYFTADLMFNELCNDDTATGL